VVEVFNLVVFAQKVKNFVYFLGNFCIVCHDHTVSVYSGRIFIEISVGDTAVQHFFILLCPFNVTEFGMDF
jgi:hypothetical protein